jgi:hypothetical protein
MMSDFDEKNPSSSSSLPSLLLTLSQWNDLLQTLRGNAASSDHIKDCAFAITAVEHQLKEVVHYDGHVVEEEKGTCKDSNCMIVKTRKALRVALIISSQKSQQEVALTRWHSSLLSILLHNNHLNDSKCQTLAAQVLTNCITNNSITATILTQQIIPQLTPTTTTKDFQETTNWTDLLIRASSTSRSTLMGVTACLYNCMCARNDDTWTKEIANCPLLIATSLRNSLHLPPQQQQNDNSDNHLWKLQADEATQWIELIIIKLWEMGHFPCIYQSLSSSMDVVVPEQMVLLHLIENNNNIIINNKSDHCEQMALFLTRTLLHYSSKVSPANVSPTSRNVDDVHPDDQNQLRRAAQELILEIIAEILVVDDKPDSEYPSSRIRQRIGESTDLLPEVTRQLARFLQEDNNKDDANTLNHKDSPNSKVTSPSSSQLPLRQAAVRVRVIGNLCFRCTYNQNVLRETRIDEKRNGLHVLLSVSSMACYRLSLSNMGCFLREWTVVAIRNVLDQNPDNQAIVAELEAHAPVQSETLQELGIRLECRSGGSVSITNIEQK